MDSAGSWWQSQNQKLRFPDFQYHWLPLSLMVYLSPLSSLAVWVCFGVTCGSVWWVVGFLWFLIASHIQGDNIIVGFGYFPQIAPSQIVTGVSTTFHPSLLCGLGNPRECQPWAPRLFPTPGTWWGLPPPHRPLCPESPLLGALSLTHHPLGPSEKLTLHVLCRLFVSMIENKDIKRIERESFPPENCYKVIEI